MSEDKDTFLFILGVQTLTLLNEGHHTAKGKDARQQYQRNDKADGNITYKKRDDTATGSTSRPIDVATLKTQKFKRPLKPLEHWIIWIEIVNLFHAKAFSQITQKYRRT